MPNAVSGLQALVQFISWPSWALSCPVRFPEGLSPLDLQRSVSRISMLSMPACTLGVVGLVHLNMTSLQRPLEDAVFKAPSEKPMLIQWCNIDHGV